MKKLLIFLGALAAYGTDCTISDTVRTPFGGYFAGRIVVALNSPASAQPLYSGSQTLTGWQTTIEVPASANGAVAVTLVCTDTITPAGTSYSARYQPTSGSGWAETWSPATGTTTIRAMRATTVPTPTTTFQASQIVPGSNGQVLTTTGRATAWGSVPACATCVVTSGSYSDPTWITGLAYSKLTGSPSLASIATSGSAADLSTGTVAPERIPYLEYVKTRFKSATVNAILDTDFGEDSGDPIALSLLHALADNGEVNILGIVNNTARTTAPAAISAVNYYYGRQLIPVGTTKHASALTPTDSYATLLGANYPNEFNNSIAGANAPNATTLYRKLLASQPDASVTIISIGYMRNIKDLWDSAADSISPLTGAQLIAAKVAQVVVMGGDYPSGTEYNFQQEPATAAVINSMSAIPMVFAGYTMGNSVSMSMSSSEAYHPARAACLAFGSLVRAAWDSLAVLYAVRGLSYSGTTYFAATTGTNSVNGSTGANTFTSGAGAHKYLTLSLSTSSMATLLNSLQSRTPTARPYPAALGANTAVTSMVLTERTQADSVATLALWPKTSGRGFMLSTYDGGGSTYVWSLYDSVRSAEVMGGGASGRMWINSSDDGSSQLKVGGTVTATTFSGALTGNASTATALASTVASGRLWIGQGTGVPTSDSVICADTTNHRLGVGTCSPSYPIQVTAAASADASVRVLRTSTTNYASYDLADTGSFSASNILWQLGKAPGSQYFSFRTWNGSVNTDPLAINAATGSVMIGTTTDLGYGLHAANKGTNGNLLVFDATATTGVSSQLITAGQGQGSTPVFRIRAYNATPGSGTLGLSILDTGRIVTASANEATGAGTPLLGANSPAVTNTAPYTWLKFTTSDGSTVYVPAWK